MSEIKAASASEYSPEDRAFHAFWYGHMHEDLMQAPLIGVRYAQARYIWDAARSTPKQGEADTVQLIGVKSDGTEHVIGTATMPPKMKAREIVREMFGQIDEEAADDGAMALWCCENLIEWMESTAPRIYASPSVEPPPQVESAATHEQASPYTWPGGLKPPGRLADNQFPPTE